VKQLTNEEQLLIAIKADTTNLMSGLKTASSGMNNFASKIGSIGKTMTVAGAAITAGFAMAIKTASGFEQSMANTASVAGATSEELQRMSDAAREMGKQSIYSASQAADAMYYLGSAGLEADQIIGALSGTMTLAAATQSDLAFTSEAITATLAQYNLEAEEASRVSNVFAAAISGSQATMEKLKNSMSYVGPMAKSMGISLEETTGILMNLYNAGLDGSKAGTSLRMAFAKLLDPTEKATTALDHLEVSITDSSGEMRPFKDIIDDLGIAGMSASDAMDIFGQRAGPALMALVAQGEGAIEKMTKKVTGTNKAAEMAAIQMATFKGAVTVLKSAFEELQIIIANHIMPTINVMVKGITKAINAVSAWMEKNKFLTDIIVKLGATIGALALVGGPILMAVSAFGKMKLAMIGIVTYSNAMVLPAIAAVKGALLSLGTIATGPIGLLILAVGGLYIAWETNLFGMKDITKEVFGDIKSKFEDLEEGVKRFTEVSDSLGGGGGGVGAFADDIDDLATSMDGLETETDDAKEALDEFGNKIETFDEWVKRLEEEATKANKKMADEAETAYERYTDAMQPIEDRLYELSHTEEEVAARNLLKKKEELEEKAKALKLGADKEKAELTKIKEWYDKEIGLIVTKLKEQQDALIETAKTTETSANTQIAAIREIKKEWGGLIDKIEGVGTAAEKAASKAATEAFLAKTPTIGETGYKPDYIPEDIPKYAAGTPYVPRTELALIHKGERITTAAHNNNTNSYSPTINITIEGDGDESKVRRIIEKALEESTRQFNRTGNVLIPGMA